MVTGADMDSTRHLDCRNIFLFPDEIELQRFLCDEIELQRFLCNEIELQRFLCDEIELQRFLYLTHVLIRRETKVGAD